MKYIVLYATHCLPLIVIINLDFIAFIVFKLVLTNFKYLGEFLYKKWHC